MSLHVSTDPNMLTFTEGQIIDIKSKGSGNKPDLWGGELNGKLGYFPSNLVKETKIFEAKPKFHIPTGLPNISLNEEDDTEIDESTDTQKATDVETEIDPTDLDDTEIDTVVKKANEDDTEIPDKPKIHVSDETELGDETELADETVIVSKDSDETGTVTNDFDETEITNDSDDTEITNESDDTEITNDSDDTEITNESDDTEITNDSDDTEITNDSDPAATDKSGSEKGGMFGFDSAKTEDANKIEPADTESMPPDQIEQAEELNKILLSQYAGEATDSDESEDTEDNEDDNEEGEEDSEEDELQDEEEGDEFFEEGDLVEEEDTKEGDTPSTDPEKPEAEVSSEEKADDGTPEKQADEAASKEKADEPASEEKADEAASEELPSEVTPGVGSHGSSEEQKTEAESKIVDAAEIADKTADGENDAGEKVVDEAIDDGEGVKEADVDDTEEAPQTNGQHSEEGEQEPSDDTSKTDGSKPESIQPAVNEDKVSVEPTATQKIARTEISSDETTIHGLDDTTTILVDGTTILEWDGGETVISPSNTVNLDASISTSAQSFAVEQTPALGNMESATVNSEPGIGISPAAKLMEMTAKHIEPTGTSSAHIHHATVDDSLSSQLNGETMDTAINATDSGVGDGLQDIIKPNDQYTTVDFVSRKPLEMMESEDTVHTPPPSPTEEAKKDTEVPDSQPKLDESKMVDENNNILDENNNIEGVKMDHVTEEHPEGTPEAAEDKQPAVDKTSVPVDELLYDEKMRSEMPEYEPPSVWQDLVQGLGSIFSFADPLHQLITDMFPSLGHIKVLPALASFVLAIATMIMMSHCGYLGSENRLSKKKLADLAETLHKLGVITTERDQLSERLNAINKQLNEQKNRSTLTSSEVHGMRERLDSAQQRTAALEQQLSQKDEELLELSQSLDDLAASVRTKDEEIEQFRQRDAQMTEYSGQIEQQLTEVQTTLNHNQVSLMEVQTQLQANTEEVTVLQQCKDQLLLEADEWSEQNQSLKKQMEEIEENTKKYQDMVAFKENEIEVWKDCFKQLKILQDEAKQDGDENDENEHNEDEDDDETDVDREQVMTAKMQEKLQAMIDVANVNARLKAVQEENQTLSHRVQIETESRKEIEEQVKQFRFDAEAAKDGQRRSEHKEQEAATKLNVLQSYFQQKELEMQKELGEQQARQKDSVGQLESADSKTRMIKTEMDSLRSQVEDLKKEIDTSESEHRKQLAANEKKVHENWLAARQAEREMKEAKSEAASLRMKLVDLDRQRELESPMPLPHSRLLGVMNGPPRPHGPMLPPGPPFPGPQGGAMPMFGDRPGSRGGPPMFTDRPGSRGTHPGAPHPPVPSPNMLREGSPLDRDRMIPIAPGDRLPFLPADRPIPPSMREPLPPPHLLDRDRPPMHPMDRDRPFLPDFRRPPSDLRGPMPPPMDARRSPPGPYPRDRRSPPPPHYRGPPLPRGPPPPMMDRRGPPPPNGRGPFPPDGPPGSYGSRPHYEPRTSSPRSHDNKSISPSSQSFV